jgi:hypothetical protein
MKDVAFAAWSELRGRAVIGTLTCVRIVSASRHQHVIGTPTWVCALL